jgi:hypothetical protein
MSTIIAPILQSAGFIIPARTGVEMNSLDKALPMDNAAHKAGPVTSPCPRAAIIRKINRWPACRCQRKHGFDLSGIVHAAMILPS